MSWNIVTDIVQGINQVGQSIMGLVDSIVYSLVMIMTAMLYPFAVILQNTIDFINTLAAPFLKIVNLLITVPQIPQYVFSVFLPLPSPLITLILIEIMIIVSVKFYKYVEELVSWFWIKQGVLKMSFTWTVFLVSWT